jgi:hypothetical protein
VRQVVEHHLTDQTVVRLGDLIKSVLDQIDVDVGPLEMQTIDAVGRICVGEGEPSERFPIDLCERFSDKAKHHSSNDRRCEQLFRCFDARTV